MVTLTVLSCSASASAYINSHDLRTKFSGMKVKKKLATPIPPSFGTQQTSPSSQEVFIGKKLSESQQTGLAQAAINIDAGLTERSRGMPSSSLPHAAYGMLSPEIVARVDDNTINRRTNPAVHRFLRTYRRKGPMSCLEMLSDPEILPHLTEAMRDII